MERDNATNAWMCRSLRCWMIIILTGTFYSLFLQVYWIGPILGAVLGGVSYEFFFASSASQEKLIACITCKDIEIVETASVSRSSLLTVTQSAMRVKPTAKVQDQLN